MIRIPCKLCGDEALPATIERTGGYCMPCFKHPEERKKWVEEMQRPKPQNLEEGITLLHAHLGPAIIAVASRAVQELGHEGIYGFNIHMAQFGVGEWCDVFTEAALIQTWNSKFLDQYGPFDPQSVMAQSVKWSVAYAPHAEYSYSTGIMADVILLYKDLWPFREEEGILDRITRRAIWAGMELRQSGVLPESVMITVMTDPMGDEEKLAVAEYLNGESTLLNFAKDLHGLRAEVLEEMRATYRDMMSVTD